jgi:hypothetical protein
MASSKPLIAERLQAAVSKDAPRAFDRRQLFQSSANRPSFAHENHPQHAVPARLAQVRRTGRLDPPYRVPAAEIEVDLR